MAKLKSEPKSQKPQPPHLAKACLLREAGTLHPNAQSMALAPRAPGEVPFQLGQDGILVIWGCLLFLNKTRSSTAVMTPTSSGAVFSSSV